MSTTVPVTIDESVANGTCLFCGERTSNRGEPPRVFPAHPDSPLVLVRMCDDCAEDFDRWRAEQQRARPQ